MEEEGLDETTLNIISLYKYIMGRMTCIKQIDEKDRPWVKNKKNG